MLFVCLVAIVEKSYLPFISTVVQTSAGNVIIEAPGYLGKVMIYIILGAYADVLSCLPGNVGEIALMAHRVLIPLDGSKVAEEAVTHVMALLPPETTEIHLLTVLPDLERLHHVVQVPVVTRQLEEASRSVRKQQEQYTRAYLDMIAWSLEDAGYSVQTHLAYGQPATSIVHVAQALDVDLVVMTSHGRGGNLLWRYGSVAGRVLEVCECPVLVVPVREQLRAAQEIPQESRMAA